MRMINNGSKSSLKVKLLQVHTHVHTTVLDTKDTLHIAYKPMNTGGHPSLNKPLSISTPKGRLLDKQGIRSKYNVSYI